MGANTIISLLSQQLFKKGGFLERRKENAYEGWVCEEQKCDQLCKYIEPKGKPMKLEELIEFVFETQINIIKTKQKEAGWFGRKGLALGRGLEGVGQLCWSRC